MSRCLFACLFVIHLNVILFRVSISRSNPEPEPEPVCEVSLQRIRRYNGLLNATIIFLDTLVVSQAVGTPCKWSSLPRASSMPEDIGKLPVVVDTDKEMGYICDTIALTWSKLQGEVPLIEPRVTWAMVKGRTALQSNIDQIFSMVAVK
jgi:hypothetical protein